MQGRADWASILRQDARMQVTLETITPDNYEAVCDLDVNEAQ